MTYLGAEDLLNIELEKSPGTFIAGSLKLYCGQRYTYNPGYPTTSSEIRISATMHYDDLPTIIGKLRYIANELEDIMLIREQAINDAEEPIAA